MKKILSLVLIILAVLGVVGCGQTGYPDLPDNAIAFEMGEYVDTEDDDAAAYGTIVYQGRTYMPYGTLGRRLSDKDINNCIGYIVQDEKTDTDERVYTLAGDAECNYLMEYYAATDNEMNQSSFWRAIDTRGKNITTPVYIDSLDYSYWK